MCGAEMSVEAVECGVRRWRIERAWVVDLDLIDRSYEVMGVVMTALLLLEDAAFNHQDGFGMKSRK